VRKRWEGDRDGDDFSRRLEVAGVVGVYRVRRVRRPASMGEFFCCLVSFSFCFSCPCFPSRVWRVSLTQPLRPLLHPLPFLTTPLLPIYAIVSLSPLISIHIHIRPHFHPLFPLFPIVPRLLLSYPGPSPSLPSFDGLLTYHPLCF
jgi:hypothetical protein